MSVIVKPFQMTKKRRVEDRRNLCLIREPGEDVVVRDLQQLLEAPQILLLQLFDRRIRETAQQQVHFAYAAMPSAKAQPPAADFRVRRHEILAQLRPVTKSPEPARRPYIAASMAAVIVARPQGRIASR